MKKLILLFAFAFIGQQAFSQTVNDIPIKEIDVAYVQIVGTSKLMSTKLSIRIDFGQETKFFSGGREAIVKDASGKPTKFNSMIDALNFMNENGYDFVSAYTLTMGNQNVYHFLLRKSE